MIMNKVINCFTRIILKEMSLSQQLFTVLKKSQSKMYAKINFLCSAITSSRNSIKQTCIKDQQAHFIL